MTIFNCTICGEPCIDSALPVKVDYITLVMARGPFVHDSCADAETQEALERILVATRTGEIDSMDSYPESFEEVSFEDGVGS